MADNILKARVRHAYKTDAEWANANPVLLKGEIAYSSDIKQTKTGDGTAHWADLEYDVAKPAWHEHDLSEMINKLGTGTATPVNDDYYVSQWAGGGTTNTTYIRRPVSALWEYIKAKLHKVATSGSYNDLSNKPTTGTASTAGLTKLYTGVGTATDGSMTQAAIKTALDKKANSTLSTLNDITATPSYEAAITPSYMAVASSPFARDLWHDHLAFLAGNHEIMDSQMSTDGTTWATPDTTNDVVWKNLFQQKENQRIIILPTNLIARRFTLYTKNFRYSGINWFEISVTNSDPFSNFKVTIEASSDNKTWISLHESIIQKNSCPWYCYTDKVAGNSYIRFTFTKTTNLTTGSVYMSCIKGYTTRKGDQGLGIENEYPYKWDADRNIFPVTNGNKNLGSPSQRWNNVYANTFQGNLNGSANSATKLATARNISANDDYIMNFNFDGSGNVSTQLRAYNAIIAVANANNYPYHRFAKLDTLTDSYRDRVTNLLITQDFNGGGWGICRIVLRTNNQSNTLSSASVDWLVRCGLAADSVQIGLYTKDGSTYADAFFKTVGTYWSTTIRNLGSGSRGNIGRTWTFINSSEAVNTTTTDKKTSYEVYTSVADAGTKLHNQAYTSTITGVDVGTVKYANTSGSATSAEKATKDSANQQINTTYIKGLSASGKTITYTKGDNKTGTATISGFVPMEGTTKDNPMTGAIIQSSTDNGNTYLAGYTPSGSRLITSSSSGTRTTELTPSSFTTNLETGDAETSGALDVTFYPQKNKQMIYLGGSSSDWIIRGVGTPVQDGDAVNKNYIDSTLENWSNDLVEELQGLIPVYGTWEDTPVTGNIVFNGKATVTGVKEPSSDSDVATKGYVDRQNSIKSVTLTAAGWTGTAAPYTQTVKVDGITEDDNPVMVSMLAAGATPDTQKAYNKAFGIICSGTGTTANGSVTFSVYSKPATDITVGLKGV